MGTLQIKERYSYAAGEWREPFAEAQVPYDELMGFAKFAATLALRLRLRWSKSNQKRPAAVPTEHNCRSVIQHISSIFHLRLREDKKLDVSRQGALLQQAYRTGA